MAKNNGASKTSTTTFEKISPKKHSVRFDTNENDPMLNGIYLSRVAAEKLGVDLEKVKSISVAITFN